MGYWFNTALGRLRLVGIIEGISYLVLLVCTALKYTLDRPELVRTPGMVHGILCIIFVIALIDVHINYKWTFKKSLIALVASLLPFGNFVIDAKLLRTTEPQ